MVLLPRTLCREARLPLCLSLSLILALALCQLSLFWRQHPELQQPQQQQQHHHHTDVTERRSLKTEASGAHEAVGRWRELEAELQQGHEHMASQRGLPRDTDLHSPEYPLPSEQDFVCKQREETCFPGFSEESWKRNPAWFYKAFPPHAACTVQGLLIEELEPDLNFRRPYALRYVDDDRPDPLMPFLRPNQDRSLRERPRRVLLDLGANAFSSSVAWFLRSYPLEFTEIHAFEAREGLFRIPPPGEYPATPEDLISTMEPVSKLQINGPLLFPPKEVLDRIHAYEAFVGANDSQSEGGVRTVNITRFMKDELGLTGHDTVIVKMDIEHAEWDVLPVWLGDPDMAEIIDELFVELHYTHPSIIGLGWTNGPSREAAYKMYRDLRRCGFFTHPWF